MKINVAGNKPFFEIVAEKGSNGVKLVDSNHFLYDGSVRFISTHGLSKIKDGKNDPPRENEVIKCAEWIMEFCQPRKTINYRRGSYGLKHVVERYNKEYIGNGAFILAALLLGYKYERNGPNAYFNMSFKPWNQYVEANKVREWGICRI